MFQIKLAAQLMMPLALVCSLAAAQQPASIAKSTTPAQLKPQTPAPPPLDTQPRQGVSVPDEDPIEKTPPVQSAATDILPTACATPVYAAPPRDVFGAYVPYAAQPKPTACTTPSAQAAHTGSSLPSSSAVQKQQPDSLKKITSFNLAQPTNKDLSTLAFDSTPSAGESSSTSGYVRPVPAPHPAKDRSTIRPFRSIAIGFKADSLGAGVEIATPLARNFNLRSGINIFSFDYPFIIDGLNYDARLHLKSSETALDWFPLHGSFHISPGILYVKNTVAATTFAGPGQSFTLGTQTFINSVDDPVGGSASLVFPRTLAPMLLIGFGNIIPRSGRHLSVPFEIGAAYTGTPQISVALSGTACTTNGCASFASNALAQTFLKQEIYDLNEDLKRLPVYPIVSLGLAYHF
jgi:hypothetical protein